MANTAKTTTTKKTAQTTTAQDKKIAELEAQIAKLTSMLGSSVTSTEETSSEINPRKKTKVTSLTYGALTLYCRERGFKTFSEYGQTLVLSYSELCDYVNNCRDAAQEGMFYIQDYEMVKDLGLDQYYDNLVTNSMVDGIVSGKITDYDEALKRANETQKQNLFELFCDYTLSGKLTDLNIIDRVGHLLDKDIYRSVKEAQEILEASK